MSVPFICKRSYYLHIPHLYISFWSCELHACSLPLYLAWTKANSTERHSIKYTRIVRSIRARISHWVAERQPNEFQPRISFLLLFLPSSALWGPFINLDWWHVKLNKSTQMKCIFRVGSLENCIVDKKFTRLVLLFYLVYNKISDIQIV